MSSRVIGLAAFFMVAIDSTVLGGPPTKIDLRPEYDKFGLTPLQQGDRSDCSLFAVTALAEFESAKKTPDKVQRSRKNS